MFIDVNIFINNKNDEFQKALAILEIASTNNEINYYASKHSIKNELIEASKIIYSKFNRKEISIKVFEKLNVNNYKLYM